MIKQLQENQLALTEGLDKNRLAITQGFDKMDEVKKWDLLQLPGYEAIEEPEEKESEASEEPEEKESEVSEEPEEFPVAEEPILYKISHRDLNKRLGEDVYPDDDRSVYMHKINFEKNYRTSPNRDKYINRINKITGELKLIKKPITLSYEESDMDKNLNYKKVLIY